MMPEVATRLACSSNTLEQPYPNAHTHSTLEVVPTRGALTFEHSLPISYTCRHSFVDYRPSSRLLSISGCLDRQHGCADEPTAASSAWPEVKIDNNKNPCVNPTRVIECRNLTTPLSCLPSSRPMPDQSRNSLNISRDGYNARRKRYEICSIRPK